MRRTILGAALALLALGCGIDDSTAPNEPRVIPPEPLG